MVLCVCWIFKQTIALQHISPNKFKTCQVSEYFLKLLTHREYALYTGTVNMYSDYSSHLLKT